jgi:transposase
MVVIMPETRRVVIGGVDTHKDLHFVAAIDTQGRRLGCRPFAANTRGYKEAFSFLEGFGEIGKIGIECTGTYGAGLARAARRRGLEVLEVLFGDREERHRRGKDDEMDAYQAADAALCGKRCATAKEADNVIAGLRALKVAHDGAVKASTAALNALQGLVVSLDDELREELRSLDSEALVARCAAFRVTGSLATTKMALRLIARRIQALGTERDLLKKEMDHITSTIAPATRALMGMGPINTTVLLLTVGSNPERFKNESSFSVLCGTSPLPHSSGKTTYFRLSRSGDRKANSAIHTAALSRLANDSATKEFYERKIAEGKGKKGALRCLKRYLARVLFGALKSDLATLGCSA